MILRFLLPLFVLGFSFISFSLSAQIRVTNDQGDVYIVYPDNSWRLIEKGGVPQEGITPPNTTDDITMDQEDIDIVAMVARDTIIEKVQSEEELALAKSYDDLYKNREKVHLANIISAKKNQCSSMLETDPYTGQQKTSLPKQYFFSYTPDALVSFLKEQEFISCEGYLSQIKDEKLLNLEFTFNSLKAQKEYGGIIDGAQLILKTLNGESTTISSKKETVGKVNRTTGQTTFSTFYPITKHAEKVLSKEEVTSINVVWKTGFETYEVYELDFFIDQFNCLDQIRKK